MPCYNAGKWIGFSIESVLHQTYPNWELIVTDDCSTDDSYRLAEQYAAAEKRIKLLRNETNQGVAGTRNRGIENAAGTYIAFLDADDLWDPTKLEKQIKLMLEKDAAITYTAQRFLDTNGEIVGKTYFPPEEITHSKLLHSNVMCCSSVIVRTEIMKRHLFEKDVFHEDFVSWLNILKEVGRGYCIGEPLTLYRSMSGTKSSNKLRSTKGTYGIYRRYYKFSLIKSWYLLFFYAIYGMRKYRLRG